MGISPVKFVPELVSDSRSRESILIQVLRQALKTLVNAMCHGLFGEPDEVAETRSRLQEIAATVSTLTTDDSIATASRNAAALFRRQNERAGSAIARQQAELQPTIAALSQTLGVTGDGIELGVTRLEELSVQLRRVCCVQDGEQKRTALMNCMQIVREEIKRQTASIETIHDVRRQLAETAESDEPLSPVSLTAPVDPTTGLQARVSAEKTLTLLLEAGRLSYVAVFVLPRLQVVTLRYGSKAGDPVLLRFSQHVAQRIGNNDRLFRWGPTSFVGLFQRSVTATEFQAEIAVAVPTRMESFVDGRSRTVMFTTDCHWSTFSPEPGEPVDTLIHKIDTFIRGATA